MNSLLKYNRARLHVLDRIAALQLQPGDLLPTQQELLAGGGFSLICLKRALAELESEGVVSKGQGRRACLLKRLERNDFSGFVVFLCLYRYTPAIPSDVYIMRDEFARRGIELRIEAVKRPDVDLSGICRGALGMIGWIICVFTNCRCWLWGPILFRGNWQGWDWTGMPPRLKSAGCCVNADVPVLRWSTARNATCRHARSNAL